MKPQMSRKRRAFAGKPIFMRGMREMSWKVLMRAQRDSREDWLKLGGLTDSTARWKG